MASENRASTVSRHLSEIRQSSQKRNKGASAPSHSYHVHLKRKKYVRVSSALRQTGVGDSKIQPSGTAAARELLHERSQMCTGSSIAMVRKKQKEMPRAAMMGWSTNDSKRSGTACHCLPARMRETARRMSAVATLRGCRC